MLVKNYNLWSCALYYCVLLIRLYIGLPVGDLKSLEDFWDEKFRYVEKSLYDWQSKYDLLQIQIYFDKTGLVNNLYILINLL